MAKGHTLISHSACCGTLVSIAHTCWEPCRKRRYAAAIGVDCLVVLILFSILLSKCSLEISIG